MGIQPYDVIIWLLHPCDSMLPMHKVVPMQAPLKIGILKKKKLDFKN